MSRLRLAPSSPERMAELTRQLYQRHGAGSYYTGVSEHPKPETAIGWVHAATRAARLLLRWYAHGSACAVLAEEDKHAWGLAGHDDPAYRYHQEWCTKYIYQLWPQDGDERLRRELMNELLDLP